MSINNAETTRRKRYPILDSAATHLFPRAACHSDPAITVAFIGSYDVINHLSYTDKLMYCRSAIDMTDKTTLKNRLINRRALFWDISPERIATALDENDDWAIVRIFQYGSIEDIHNAIKYYSPEKAASVLSREKLRPTAHVMAYLFLNVDPEKRYLSSR